jgi:hypothetical protein
MFCALATLIRTNMTRKWLPDWCMTASGEDLQALILLTVLFKPLYRFLISVFTIPLEFFL